MVPAVCMRPGGVVPLVRMKLPERIATRREETINQAVAPLTFLASKDKPAVFTILSHTTTHHRPPQRF